MRGLKFIFFAVIVLFVSLSSCSLQKRHYRNGFYLEHTVSASLPKTTGTKKTTKYSILEKLHTDVTSSKTETLSEFQNTSQEQITIITKNNQDSYREIKHKTFKPIIRNIKHETAKPEIPDPKLNHVAKAGLRMIGFSFLFLAAAFYIFFKVPMLFYFVLGLFLIAFLFALVALLTSISAGKDKIANDKKGILFAKLTFFLSILVFCSIALFIIFTAIVL